MSRHFKLSRLDGELSTLGAFGARQSLEELQRGVLTPALAWTAPSAPPEITVKLIVAPGQEATASRYVESVGGRWRVRTKDGTIGVVELPFERVSDLGTQEWLLRAEAVRELKLSMDKAVIQAGNLPVALTALPQGITGQGVVLGIIDTGVDWQHPAFNDPTGSALEMFAVATFNNSAGVSHYQVFEKAQLEAAMQGNGYVPPGDLNGHGTHCASIAVGRHHRFKGIAPGAALMAVRSESLREDHAMWAIGEFFRRAGSRPAVVSISLGGHLGPHDGTTALEEMISHESGPGRIVVVSAGNEGEDGIHWHRRLTSDEDVFISVHPPTAKHFAVDLWYPRGDDIDITIETPDGVSYEPDGTPRQTVFGLFKATGQEHAINRDFNVTLQIVNATPGHIWRIRLRAGTITQGDVHAWATEQFAFGSGTGADFSIGMPATADRAIVVGSFVSKNTIEMSDGHVLQSNLRVGQLSPFSSHGPSRTGAQKPDIAAPGQYITAALAQGSVMASDPNYMPRHHPSGGCITFQGTSMATPFVAGVIALMLQRDPELTPEEIIRSLRASAQRDSETGPVWNPAFGWGKLDCRALLANQLPRQKKLIP